MKIDGLTRQFKGKYGSTMRKGSQKATINKKVREGARAFQNLMVKATSSGSAVPQFKAALCF